MNIYSRNVIATHTHTHRKLSWNHMEPKKFIENQKLIPHDCSPGTATYHSIERLLLQNAETPFFTTEYKIQPFYRMVSRHPVAPYTFAWFCTIRVNPAFGMIIYQLQILNIVHLLYKMNVPCLTCSF